MLYCALVDIDKRASSNNTETIGVFEALYSKNSFLFADREGEEIDYGKIDLPHSVDLLNVLYDSITLPGLNSDLTRITKPQICNTKSETYDQVQFNPYILVNPIFEQPAFIQLADFLDCNLKNLIDSIAKYLRNQENHTVDGFFNSFSSFDRLIAYDERFLHEAQIIYDGTEQEYGRINDDLVEDEPNLMITQVAADLRPYSALQIYGQQYYEDPDTFGDVELFDRFCSQVYHPISEATLIIQKSQEDEFELLDRYTLNPDDVEARRKFIEDIRNSQPDLDQHCHLIYCPSYCDLLYSMFRLMLSQKLRLKRCKNCGRFFVAIKRADVEYCTRPSPQNPNLDCRSIGPMQKYNERTANDQTAKKERRVYGLLFSRCKLHPENPQNKINFDEFAVEKKRRKKEIKQGISDLNAYDRWLDEMAEKYQQK